MVDKIENYCLLEKNDIESAVSNFYNEPVTISEMDVVLIDNVDTFESMFYMSLQIRVPKLMNLDSEEQIVSNY